MMLKVMTFNMRYNTASDGDNAWPNRVESAIELIRKHKPAIMGTQEGLIGMLTDLQQHLPEYAWIGKARMEETDEYCAIFYNKNELLLRENGQFWLSETPEHPSISWNSACPRICTWACFELVNDPHHQLLVYNVHLDHVSQEAREKGATLIWQHMKQWDGQHSTQLRWEQGGKQGVDRLPVLLMGDFNSEPSNKVIQFFRGPEMLDGEKSELKDVYTLMEQPVGGTYHGFNGGDSGEPIDYIFVSPAVQVKDAVIDREKIKGKYPSDHYPLIATIEF